VTFTDATQHHLVEQMLTIESHQDPLTSLANRRAFLECLEGMWGNPQDVMVVMVDVDKFKSINDRYGHSVGDEVLVAVAQGLRASVRTEDLVARLGGDEFALVCSADDSSEEILARVSGEFASDIDTSAGPITVRVSVGVARPEVGDTPNDLLRVADQSMYRDKRGEQATPV
jgi:diguanylate cyclase (GGDEF)-like protein